MFIVMKQPALTASPHRFTVASSLLTACPPTVHSSARALPKPVP